MLRWIWLVTVIGAAPGGAGAAEEAARAGEAAERAAAWLSPEVSRIDARLGEIEGGLAGLPDLQPGPVGSRFGFRSEILFAGDEPQWLQIDLGRRREIDRLVVVPVHIPALGARGAGYGFPRRFKIEVADDPGMAGAVTVADRTAADVANPGRHPLLFRPRSLAGRYIRFTSTRHFPVEEGFLWALEEIVVLHGNLNIGINCAATASSNLELFPNWSVQRINDGMSGLGLPVTLEASPSRGHLSALTPDPKEAKWLAVDLGGEQALDEVRIMAVEAENFEVLGRRALPRVLAVELATDPGFGHVVWRQSRAIQHPGLPGGNALVIPCDGRRGRYLRLVSAELWGRTNESGFGVAELQAYAGGVNVALGKPVTVSDAATGELFPGWAPEFAVDGFSSRGRLVELPEYLDLIERRGNLERERDRLQARRAGLVQATGWILGWGGGGIGLALVLGWGWLLARQRHLRRQALARLREQIARDLHDDIGSNLGGIVLLSEMGSRHSADPQAREDFAAIKETAEETARSMQDIVWLIGRGNTGLRDLLTRMRLAAHQILGDKEVAWTIEPPEFRDRELSLLVRRHVFFAFKETLNNVRRHAAAKAVGIQVSLAREQLGFSVRDDGVGFDAARAAATGHGLANLARRAARLHGRCRVDSSPGCGTLVEFTAPLGGPRPSP
jgi:signal transduction histidine kinase